MPIALDTCAARLPELDGGDRDAFVLMEVSGRRGAPALGDVSPAPYRGGAVSDARPPLCIALAIDASSSMRGARFALALQATRNVVDSLGPQDRLAVVTFDRSARVVLGPVALDAEGADHARRALDRLGTGVGTNLGAGWREAADAVLRVMVPGAVRRVLLLTDGYPSRGELAPEALRQRVAEGHGRGVETSVVGIGDGIDERLCAALAAAGEGRFHYVRDEGPLGDVVASEVEGFKRLAARDVSVLLALSSRVERAEVLHRYPCRPEGRALEVRLGAVSWDQARVVLVSVGVSPGDGDSLLGVAVAQGRRADGGRADTGTGTAAGYALGARDTSEDGSDGTVESPRQSLILPEGVGADEARRRIAHEFLVQRTATEVRSAWDALDAGDREAITRRLDRARTLRRLLADAGLVDAAALSALPDVDLVQEAMLGAAGSSREERRRLTSWAHNTQVSFIGNLPRKDPDKR